MILNTTISHTKMETNRFNLIDDYLLERLTNSEAQEFEKEMATNDELRHQVTLCRELKEAILEDDVANLRKQLIKSRDEVKIAEKSNLSNLFKVAAVLMLMSVATFFLWKVTDSSTNLFDKYYARYEISSTSRDSNLSNHSIQNEIIQLYQQGQFEKAIPALQNYLNDRPQDQVCRLMLASAYLESNKPHEAEKLLQSTMEKYPEGLYTETVEWYLCLAYLSQANYNEALILANKIKMIGGRYATKANEINDNLSTQRIEPTK